MPTFGEHQVTEGSGTKVQTVVVDTDKEREVVVLGDPDTNAAVQKVTNSAPGGSDYGAVTRPILGSGTNAIGRVGHDVTGIGDGRKTVTTAGTRETLAASTACKKVIITAETDNTGLVVVGGTGVVAALATRRGTPLYAGDTVVLEVDDLNDVNLDVTVSGDGVTYTYLT